MAQSTHKHKHKKKQNKEASETFFLYVFFHAIWTGIFKIFED